MPLLSTTSMNHLVPNVCLWGQGVLVRTQAGFKLANALRASGATATEGR